MSPDLFRVRQMKVVRAAAALVVAALGGAAMSGCTSAQQQGQSPAFLIVSALNAAAGATPDQFGGVLASDVITLVKIEGGGGGDGEEAPVTFAPTVFADNGEVNFVLAMKDPGSIDNPTQPSSQNFITVNRYHVVFVRADGRNTPGVDVPYPFDGGMTVTVGGNGGKGVFNLVRAQAKEEAPLRALRGTGAGGMISTIAEVTFYGFDQAGREVSVKANIGVNFGDWGDPK